MQTHRSTFGVPKNILNGQVFGRLTVMFQDDPVRVKYKDGRVRWLITWNCLCTCGNRKIVTTNHLKRRAIRSCGCLQTEVHKTTALKHGMCRTPEYNAYMGALARCTTPRLKSFKNYGGRGIKFLFTSFEQFFAELGRRPKGTTLDRRENNGNYEPGNCHWATPREQYANRRTKRIEQFSIEELTTELTRRGYKVSD